MKPKKEESLLETIAKLRAIPSGWDKIADPLAELHRIRHGCDDEEDCKRLRAEEAANEE